MKHSKKHPVIAASLLLVLGAAAVMITAGCEDAASDGNPTTPDAATETGCAIDGRSANVGEVDPTNTCRRCDGLPSARYWASLADGTACGDGRVCATGSCEAQCFVDGALRAPSSADPTNACRTCEPAVSTSAWTPRASGAACGGGKICEAAACSSKCLIGGVFYADGAVNPESDCETCNPGTSTTSWTPRSSVPLLAGGTDIAAQGWTATSQAPSEITYGADYVRLATSTTNGGKTSGQSLIVRALAVDPAKPFAIRVELQVESVNNHNQLDSGAAILGAFVPPAGNTTDRSQMIYLDSGAVGWSDDTQSAAFAVTDGAYHTYELSVDAAKVATLAIDGVAKLTRNNFTTNGTIAIGDQTNDPKVDGAMRIRSVARMCP